MFKSQKNRRKLLWTLVSVLIGAIRIAMLFSSQLQRNEATAYTVLLLLFGGSCELWQWLKTQNKGYRLAFLLGLGGLFFLGWANGAVGIIGSENNPANLMYWAVFAVRSIGSLISRLKSAGMRRTLFITALVQIIIPVFALLVWPAQASWGDAGVIGVFIINSIFGLIFLTSGILFWLEENKTKKTYI